MSAGRSLTSVSRCRRIAAARHLRGLGVKRRSSNPTSAHNSPAALPLGFLLGSERAVITAPLHLNSRRALAVIISSDVIKCSAVVVTQEWRGQLSGSFQNGDFGPLSVCALLSKLAQLLINNAFPS